MRVVFPEARAERSSALFEMLLEPGKVMLPETWEMGWRVSGGVIDEKETFREEVGGCQGGNGGNGLCLSGEESKWL